MRLVLDEYGSVSGLVTIEDVLAGNRRRNRRRPTDKLENEGTSSYNGRQAFILSLRCWYC